MSLETKKLELIKTLLKTQEKSVLDRVEEVLNTSKTDWWNDLSAEERKEIELGLKQADSGDYVAHQEVMKLFKKWR